MVGFTVMTFVFYSTLAWMLTIFYGKTSVYVMVFSGNDWKV